MSCVALTAKGTPCRFKTAPDAAFCPNHDPKNQAALSIQNRANARRKRPSPSSRLLDTSLALTDRLSIAAIMDVALRLQLAGRIPDDRARTILRYCQAAAHNFDRVPLTMDGTEHHDWRAYFQRVEGLLSTIDPLLDEANEHDATTDGA